MFITINKELRIQSCGIEDIVQEDPESVTVIYDPAADLIIINQEHPDYDIIQPLSVKYLADTSKRKYIRDYAELITGEKLTGILDLLDKVLQIRERLSKEKQAQEVYKILGKHTIDPYIKNVDMLGVIKQLDPDRYSVWDEYDTFMFGYIQGKRAERARRKKVAL